jgi:hypothetical protein
MNDLELIRKALLGDEEATKIYCGSYFLIKHKYSNTLYRFDGENIPLFFEQVNNVYDKDGFLLAKYWSLPRWNKHNFKS